MRSRVLVTTLAALGTLAACGHPASPAVPHLPGQASHSVSQAGDASPARKAKLHAAADCIRQHGIPTYKDPVLTSDGHVYTDARSVQDASDATMHAVQAACATQISAAGFQPDEQAPAPPAMVQAGVKAAQCLRANGLPHVKDPTGATLFTPGHGFGVTQDEMPSGGKQDPTVQRAFTACRALLDAEIRLSTLESLGNA